MNKEINPVSLLWRIRKQPAGVVTMILSSIPESMLLDCNIVVADLAMGDGSYLAEIARRRVANGASIEQAQSTLYGYEKSPVYLEAARKLNGLQHAKLAILKPETDLNALSMKFDVIVGNPPFQEVTEKGRKDQASNLWTKFWVKSLELAKDDGVVSLITPTSWLSPSANLKGTYKHQGKSRLWDVFDFYSSVAQVEGIEAYFKGVGSSFGVVTVDKSGSEGLTFKEGYGTGLGFLPKSGIDEVLKSVGGESTLEDHFSISQGCGSGLRVSVPLTRKVTNDSIEVLHGEEKPTKGSANPGLYLYVKVADELQAGQVKDTLVKNAAILNTHCRWSGFMNIKVCKMLNFEP
jgi:predicted RNA methylase